MADFPFDIVGFDLDGTLLDTSGDLTNAVNHTLAHAGRPLLTREQVTPMIGGGGRHMLALAMAATGGCSDDDLDRLYALLLDHYDAHIAVESKAYDGVLAALDALDAMDVRIAIVTNKQEAMADKLLRALGLRDRFAVVIGGDTLGPGNAKPSPAPILAMIERCGGGRATFVGDSIYDTQAARAAGIPSIAVSFGFRMHALAELGADAVIDRYDDLIPALLALAQGNRP